VKCAIPNAQTVALTISSFILYSQAQSLVTSCTWSSVRAKTVTSRLQQTSSRRNPMTEKHSKALPISTAWQKRFKYPLPPAAPRGASEPYHGPSKRTLKKRATRRARA